MKRVTKPATEDVAWREGSSPPDGFILWHSHVKHGARTRPSAQMVLVTVCQAVVCDCGWRQIGQHYRIDRRPRVPLGLGPVGRHRISTAGGVGEQ